MSRLKFTSSIIASGLRGISGIHWRPGYYNTPILSSLGLGAIMLAFDIYIIDFGDSVFIIWWLLFQLFYLARGMTFILDMWKRLSYWWHFYHNAYVPNFSCFETIMPYLRHHYHQQCLNFTEHMPGALPSFQRNIADYIVSKCLRFMTLFHRWYYKVASWYRHYTLGYHHFIIFAFSSRYRYFSSNDKRREAHTE